MAAGDAGSTSRAVAVSGLSLHNAVLNDGGLVVPVGECEHGSVVSISPVKLQLNDSTKRRPTSTTIGHLFYRCPVRMRDVIGEIGLPCEDSAACRQNNVYLSYSQLQ